MEFQKSQPAEAEHLSVSACLVGPTENMAAPSPAEAHTHEIHEKAGSISSTCVRVPLRDGIKKSLSTKPGWGRTAPVCSAGLSGCTSS